tara:strand:+ start:2535 stop:3212 length:678 start_codon:yes stop_codon:yes gene_type:complete
MSDEIQKSIEGTNLALAAVAEVLAKMDERMAKEETAEIEKAEAEQAVLHKAELSEMIKSIVSEAIAKLQKEEVVEALEKETETTGEVVEKEDEEEDEEEEKEEEDDDMDKGGMAYKKSEESSEIESLKKQIAELQSGIDEKIKKESDSRLRKLGFREETGLQAPEIIKHDSTMGVDEDMPIKKAQENSENVVDQLSKMSYTQLRTLQHKIQTGDTDGVPRELIEG